MTGALQGKLKLISGTRYSLFVVDYSNGLGETDVHCLDASEVAEIKATMVASVPEVELSASWHSCRIRCS